MYFTIHTYDSVVVKILKEIGCEIFEWIHLAQDRVQWLALTDMMMKLWGSQDAG
jgi:hypothetical protein